MIINKRRSVFSILNDSPFFKELSIKEREGLIADLFKTYPHLHRQNNNDTEVGYEASWLSEETYRL